MRPIFTHYTFLLTCLLLLLGGAVLPAQAQQPVYGNEWINPAQPYYKIKVVRNGLYRLDYNYLQQAFGSAGLANVNPRNLQVFRRGQEIPLFVQGEADGRIDNGDYVEFYGERNDGKTDVELYQRREFKLHDYYSLYTDTAAYFLTVHPTQAGKRITTSSLTATGLSPEAWHYQTRLALFTSHYSRGIAYANSQQPFGDKAEGFFSDFFGTLENGRNRNNPATFTVDSLLNLETSAPEPTVEIALAGTYYRDHDVTISVVAGSTERVLESNVRFGPFDMVKLRYPIRFTDIGANGTLVVRLRVNTVVPAGGIADLIRMSYIKVRYPRKNVLTNRDLVISPADSNRATPSLLLFDGGPAAAVAYDITDPANVIRYEALPAGAQRAFVIAPSPGKQRKVLLTAANKFFVPAAAQRRNFRQFNPAKAGYVIVSNKQLAKPVPDYPNPVRAYADYRASAAGGKYDTLVFYSDQLYDQFHYGDRSAVAIRRLMYYLMANGTPKHLFLVGKGIEPDFAGGNFRRNPGAYPVFDLVPTGGAPGADAIFTADFQRNAYTPRVPTGRIAAVNATEVAGYLEKVKQHEATPQNAEWRKNFLHLGGGTDANQQQLFRSYLRSYENIAKGPLLGAKVETISRQTSESSVEVVNLASQVNKGLSMITFFGHSSPTGADIDFGKVSDPINNYNNLGRYPMILLNGCFSGNAFSAVNTNDRSFGEDWILTARRGAIIFVAHSAFGYTSPLNTYSRNFYNTAFADPNFYGKPIGVINQEVIRRTALSGNEQLVTTALEMVLQADPALVLVGPEKPDYALKNNITLRSFNSFEPLTAGTDSFQVVIPVQNLGKATPDSFHIAVTRNGITVRSRVKYPPVYNQDTIRFTFSGNAGRLAGENSFVVTIDPGNLIQELEEGNNSVSFSYNFPASGARPLFPVEYAVVSTPTVTLVGQATNLLQPNRLYYFELDTARTFNSPAKQFKEISAGAVPSWTVSLLPNVAPRDSVVYFWRFRLADQVGATDTIWGESSFRYIPNSPGGWSQSQYGQFTKARGDKVQLNKSSRQWEFMAASKNLQLRAAGGQLPASFPPYGILVNGSVEFGNDCQFGNPTLLVRVFSDRTLSPYVMPGYVASTPCGMDPKTFYHFRDLRQAANREYLRKFLEAVPAGYYVALVSVNNVPFSDFSAPLKDAFRALGSRLIDSVQTGYPLALVGRKGATIGSATEQSFDKNDPLPPTLQAVDLNTAIQARGGRGTITSTMIGPASSWSTLLHTVRKNGPGNDTYRLRVIGYDLELKNPTVLLDNVRNRQQDISGINAKQYPHLQLVLEVADSLDRSAPQLKEWMVLYTGVPEGVVRADLVGVEKYANLEEQARKGKIEVKYAFQNISNFNFSDSLLVRLTLVGHNGPAKLMKIGPLKKDEIAYISHVVPTNSLNGNYTLRLSVNPLLDNPAVQPEQYYFNNTLDLPFTYTDNLPPVLDVVFDGRRIMDGEIVRPDPLISITLKDEDQYTFIQDPENLELFLQRPGENMPFEPVSLRNNNEVRFFPANKDQDFRLEFTPKNLPNGVYTLRVQGKDTGNNKSGFDPYAIRFEVINESTVTNFYPYPNPFSGKTRFVFTITGSKLPDNIKIQIMTVTGKVVKEITQSELGNIKIGNNISDYWDGTDEFGDKLANGVYLYRVVMTGTEDFKHRNSGTNGERAFKKDYGKLYILR